MKTHTPGLACSCCFLVLSCSCSYGRFRSPLLLTALAYLISLLLSDSLTLAL